MYGVRENEAESLSSWSEAHWAPQAGNQDGEGRTSCAVGRTYGPATPTPLQEGKAS